MPAVTPHDPEPRGVTLVDLIALVFGVAVAVSLPGDSFWYVLTAGSDDFRWDRLGLGKFLVLAATRSCVALLPVILARRARHGGVARPAELLASMIGLDRPPHQLDHLVFPLWAGFTPWGGRASHPDIDEDTLIRRDEQWEQWQQAMHTPWLVLLLSLGCVATWLLISRRREGDPGWVRTVLVLVAWFGASRALLCLFPIFPFSRPSASHRLARLIGYSLLVTIPVKLAFDLPAAAAWNRLRAPHAPRPTWLEWTSLAMALVLFLADQPGRIWVTYAPRDWPWNWAHLPTTAIALWIGLALARRYSRTWSGLNPAGGPD